MPINSLAQTIPRGMDPSDVLDFEMRFDQLLETGEDIASFTISLHPDSVAGAELGTASRAAAIFTKTVDGVAQEGVRFWLSINPAQQSSIVFDSGAEVGIVVRITTNSSPSRTIERTAVINVQNR